MTQPEGAGNGPANQGSEGGVTATLFTQDQMNHHIAQAKRGALDNFFKTDLGLDKALSADELKASLAAATEYRKQQEGQQGDVERLTGQLAAKTAEAEKVPALETQLLRAKLAGDAGLKSRYWKFIEGDDEEAIKASVAETLQDVGGGGTGGGEGGEGTPPAQPEQQQPARQGTGSLAPNPQQAAGGGGKPKSSMAAGRDAYKSKRGSDKE